MGAGMRYDGVQWWGYVRGPNSVGSLELTALILTDPNPINVFTQRPTSPHRSDERRAMSRASRRMSRSSICVTIRDRRKSRERSR
jgi:hypothetical protein